MPQKPLLRNFGFIFGNPLKLGKGDRFPNILESFPNIYKIYFLMRFRFSKKFKNFI